MERQPRRIWWNLALGLSLAVNFMVVGVVIGALAHRGQDGPRIPGARDRGLFGIVAMLPREERKSFRLELFKAQGSRALIEESDRKDHAALIAELRKPEVSEARLRSLLAGPRGRQDALAVSSEATLARYLAKLPLEKRLTYAKRLGKIDRGGKAGRRPPTPK